jgi:hypothetical protein
MTPERRLADGRASALSTSKERRRMKPIKDWGKAVYLILLVLPFATWILSGFALGYIHEMQNRQILSETNIQSKILFMPNGLKQTPDTYYRNQTGLTLWATASVNMTHNLTAQQWQQLDINEDASVPSFRYMNVADVNYLSLFLAILVAVLFTWRASQSY